MLTDVYEYNEINVLTFSHNVSAIFSPLAKTAYLAIAKSFIFRQEFRSKSEKQVKTECFFSPFRQFLVENRIFFKLPPFQLNSV